MTTMNKIIEWIKFWNKHVENINNINIQFTLHLFIFTYYSKPRKSLTIQKLYKEKKNIKNIAELFNSSHRVKFSSPDGNATEDTWRISRTRFKAGGVRA